MDKIILKELVVKGMSQRQMAKQLNVSQTKVKYWLDKHNLKTNNARKELPTGMSWCRLCSQSLPVEAFAKRKSGYPQAYCKCCDRKRNRESARKLKQLAVQYKGDKCIKCGYDKCLSALEFHHRDPSQKDFSISKVKWGGLTDEVKQELDKCDLLCANCHRETHELMLN